MAKARSTSTPPKRRKYRLSRAGLAKLKATIKKNRPWKKSTGPRTRAGKQRVRFNALKHGRYAGRGKKK